MLGHDPRRVARRGVVTRAKWPARPLAYLLLHTVERVEEPERPCAPGIYGPLMELDRSRRGARKEFAKLPTYRTISDQTYSLRTRRAQKKNREFPE